MALEIIDNNDVIISISREEAVNLVHLITAQLGDVEGGACPTLFVRNITSGAPKYRLSVVLERKRGAYDR